MDVLKHDPMPFFVAHVELLHSHHVLALAHSDIVVVHIDLQLDRLLPKRLHLLDGISARRQDEEERRCIGGVLVRGREHLVERQRGVAIHVVTATRQHHPNPVRQSRCHSVGPQAADHEQFLEVGLVQALPVQRQLRILRRQFIEPLFEAVGGIPLEVLRQELKVFQLDQFLNHVPSVVRQPIAQRVLATGHHRPSKQEVEVVRIERLAELPELEESEGQHCAEHELVLLEQSSVDPSEDRQPDHRDEPQRPLPHVVHGLGAFNRLVEERQE
mmetsp:Transcript_120678/g.385358  ORF Transcript_120678/g.385358 Transcript_120678/m.385358 type:complete len:272 (+) Transcript_120678:1880-2695(+)